MVSGSLTMILFQCALAPGVALAARWPGASRNGRGASRAGHALGILERRFARVETGHDEFADRKRRLPG